MKMGELMKTASLSLAQVTYTAGDVSFVARELATASTPAFQVTSKIENVSGVQLPMFECVSEGARAAMAERAAGTAIDLVALGRGGQQVQACKDAFASTLKMLVELASLQTAFQILDDVIKTTNCRVNALEYVVLPKVDNTIAYISSELDEQDREEFFRLKKIQAAKKRRSEGAEVVEGESDEEEEEGIFEENNEQDEEAKNLLDDEVDQDIIF